jgi:hypothetical protein
LINAGASGVDVLAVHEHIVSLLNMQDAANPSGIC